MNNNQSFQKGQSQTPRSPEKLSGAERNSGIKSDNSSKSAGTRSDEFKPAVKTTADTKMESKKFGSDTIESDDDTETSEGSCATTACGTGKMN